MTKSSAHKSDSILCRLVGQKGLNRVLFLKENGMSLIERFNSKGPNIHLGVPLWCMERRVFDFGEFL